MGMVFVFVSKSIANDKYPSFKTTAFFLKNCVCLRASDRENDEDS